MTQSQLFDFRHATPDDLASLVALTRPARDRLARWSPLWWSKPEQADEIHQAWLEHLLVNRPGSLRVACSNGEVVGCIAANPQPTQWFVDDVAVRDDELWPVFAGSLVSYFRDRPALTCLASRDEARASALRAAGCEHVSSYWIRSTSGSRPVDAAEFAGGAGNRPPHTFGGMPFDPAAPGALAFTTSDGTVVGSPSVKAPPIYGSGGTVTVIDLAHGPNLEPLLHDATGVAQARGDEVLCVVCDADNRPLAHALANTGFERTVEVYQFPTA